MAVVVVQVAGRRYELACRAGDEQRIEALAALVDEKAASAARAVGGMTEPRQLLMAALLLADELREARATPPQVDPALAAAIDALAARCEALADGLETGAPAP